MESCGSEEICAVTAGCEVASRLDDLHISLEREYILGEAFKQISSP